MRKKVSGLILCFALLFVLPFPVNAANQVNTMDIQAVIYEDGSMHVTQVWEGDFNEGTESYIPMNAPETLTIRQYEQNRYAIEYKLDNAVGGRLQRQGRCNTRSLWKKVSFPRGV